MLVCNISKRPRERSILTLWFLAWTLLEAEGLGCSLQHYNPMLDARIAEQWKVPTEWSLKAQLVFGKPAGVPREKTFEPLEKRLFVHGK